MNVLDGVLRVLGRVPLGTNNNFDAQIFIETTSEANKYSAPVLASVDLFVEKAQHHITYRGTLYFCLGSICVVSLALVIVLGYFHIILNPISTYANDLASIAKTIPPFDVNSYFSWQVTVLFLSRGFATAGIFSSGIYLLTILARAFFHEANALFTLRDALRFGRLFFYVKFSGIRSEDEFTNARNAISIEDLEHAFVRSRQFPSAFQHLSGKAASNKDVQDEMLHRFAEKLMDFFFEQLGQKKTGESKTPERP
jgi:hypothetical protein